MAVVNRWAVSFMFFFFLLDLTRATTTFVIFQFQQFHPKSQNPKYPNIQISQISQISKYPNIQLPGTGDLQAIFYVYNKHLYLRCMIYLLLLSFVIRKNSLLAQIVVFLVNYSFVRLTGTLTDQL